MSNAHLRLTRRGALAAGLALAVSRPAAASPEMLEAMRAFTKGAEAKPGKVKIDIPVLVENGNSVPMQVTVEGPVNAERYVKSIAVFNEKNPQPGVAVFRLGPRAGRADVSTRIRLRDSQTVTAIALMSDGSYWQDSIEVIVTLAACIET